MIDNQGERLRYFISKSDLTVDEIALLAKMNRATIFNYYKKLLLPKGKVEKILNVIGVTYDQFAKTVENKEVEDLKLQLAKCQAEKEDLYKMVIALQGDAIKKDEIVKKVKVVA